MGLNDAERYPHIRALRVCIACGRGKDPGCLVCWDCHNDLSVVYDGAYGPVVERVLQVSEVLFERRQRYPSCPWPMQMGDDGPIVDLN